MNNEQRRIDLYRQLIKNDLLENKDKSKVSFTDYLNYYKNENNVNILYDIVIGELDVVDSDGNAPTKDIFYKNYICDLPWAKKTQYCITNKYSNDWSKYPCVVSYAQDNDGQMATDGSYLINGTYYYANGRMFDGKTTTTYECVNGVPQKITGARQSNTQPGQQQPSVPPVKSKYPVPAELGGAEGIKKFQDWLDKTYPGWHTKYNTLSQNVQF